MIESKVYEWKTSHTGISNFYTGNLITQGKTADLALLEIFALEFSADKKSTQNFSSDSCENIIIVKSGELEVNLNGTQKNLEQGSVIYVLPGENFSMRNIGKVTASCLLIKMVSGKSANLQRGKEAGGSFIVDFKSQEFKPHDKGGVRNYFRDRPTAMFAFTEMHVTTLNPGIKSHEPHTHHTAEMVIMLSGVTEMQIGEKIYKAKAGDLYFLESEVSHSIRNTLTEPAMYVAFQWE